MSQIALRKNLKTASELSTFIPKDGDIVVDITNSTIVIGDGSTVGGIPLLNINYSFPLADGSQNGLMSSSNYTALQTLLAIGDASATQDGYMSAADYNLLQSIAADSGGALPNATGNVPNTLVLRDSSGNFAAGIITATLDGSINGNAATVTNGVVTTGSYANPSWITSLSASKLTGVIPSGVSFSGTIPWSSITGSPVVVSYFTNDAGYINGSGNTTGTSGGVQSTGGRETSSPTPNTMIIRSSTGTAQVATPVAASDIATKGYVDANSGGFGYYPTATINGPNPFAAGGIISPFSSSIYSETATGYIKSMVFDTVAIGGPFSSVANNTYLGFTIDGQPEQSLSITTLIAGFGIGQQDAIGSGNTFEYKCIFDLTYKISIALRIYSTISQSVSGTEFGIKVYRYLRAS